jgi:hypothetical protein
LRTTGSVVGIILMLILIKCLLGYKLTPKITAVLTGHGDDEGIPASVPPE